jgi:hypothetical protein
VNCCVRIELRTKTPSLERRRPKHPHAQELHDSARPKPVARRQAKDKQEPRPTKNQDKPKNQKEHERNKQAQGNMTAHAICLHPRPLPTIINPNEPNIQPDHSSIRKNGDLRGDRGKRPHAPHAPHALYVVVSNVVCWGTTPGVMSVRTGMVTCQKYAR